MVSLKTQLIEPKPLDVATIVVFGDKPSLKATHQGQATMFPNVKMSEILYVLSLKENLFLISMTLVVSMAKDIMENGLHQVIKNGKVALSAKKRWGVFCVIAATTSKLEREEDKLIDYHCWCRHTNLKTILLMSKIGILPLIKEREDYTNRTYQTCMKGKMTRTTIPKWYDTRKREPSELVNSNLCGPMQGHSIKGNTYIVTYLDKKTKWIHFGF